MQSNDAEAAFRFSPARGPRWSEVLWLGLPATVAALAVCWSWAVVSDITLSNRWTFAGSLRPAISPASVVLPASVPLDAILVERGQSVVAGQTVATVNVALLRRDLKRLEHGMLVDLLHRDCLLGLGTPDEGLLTSALPDHRDRQSVRMELRSCRMERLAAELKQQRIANAVQALRSQVNLLDQRIALEIGEQPGASSPRQSAREIVRLAQSRARAHAGVRELEAQAAALEIDAERERLSTAAMLSQKLDEATELRSSLLHYLDAPRILSSRSGEIVRVRSVAPGTSFSEMTEIAELQEHGARRFVASVSVPLSAATHIKLGADARVRLLGLPGSVQLLEGKVDGMTAARTGDLVEMTIALGADSEAYLADPRNGIALKGEATASAISVDLENTRMQTWMAATIAQTVPERWMEWLKTNEASEADTLSLPISSGPSATQMGPA